MTIADVAPAQLRPYLELELRLELGEGLDPDERREELDRRWEARRCADLDLGTVERRFFTQRGERAAVAYCGRCVARVQCALRALDEDARSHYPPEGVFGGLTAAQRASAIRYEESRYVG